jgi:hypothetical protein
MTDIDLGAITGLTQAVIQLTGVISSWQNQSLTGSPTAAQAQELINSAGDVGFRGNSEAFGKSVQNAFTATGVGGTPQTSAVSRHIGTFGNNIINAPFIKEQIDNIVPGGRQTLYGKTGDIVEAQRRMAASDAYSINPETGDLLLSPAYNKERAANWNKMFSTGFDNVSAEEAADYYREMNKSGYMPRTTATTEMLESRPDFARAVSNARLDQDDTNQLTDRQQKLLHKSVSDEQLMPEELEEMQNLLLNTQAGTKIRANFDANKIKSAMRDNIKYLNEMRDILGADGNPNAPINELVAAMNAITGGAYGSKTKQAATAAAQTMYLGRGAGMSVQDVIDTSAMSKEYEKIYGFNNTSANTLTNYTVASQLSAASSGNAGTYGIASAEEQAQHTQDRMASAITSDRAKASALRKILNISDNDINTEHQQNQEAWKIIKDVKEADEKNLPVNYSIDQITEAYAAVSGVSAETVKNTANDRALVSSTIASNPEIMSALQTQRTYTEINEAAASFGGDIAANRSLSDALSSSRNQTEQRSDTERAKDAYHNVASNLLNEPSSRKEFTAQSPEKQMEYLGRQAVQELGMTNATESQTREMGMMIYNRMKKTAEASGSGNINTFLEENSTQRIEDIKRSNLQAQIKVDEAARVESSGNAIADATDTNSVDDTVKKQTLNMVGLTGITESFTQLQDTGIKLFNENGEITNQEAKTWETQDAQKTAAQLNTNLIAGRTERIGAMQTDKTIPAHLKDTKQKIDTLNYNQELQILKAQQQSIQTRLDSGENSPQEKQNLQTVLSDLKEKETATVRRLKMIETNDPRLKDFEETDLIAVQDSVIDMKQLKSLEDNSLIRENKDIQDSVTNVNTAFSRMRETRISQESAPPLRNAGNKDLQALIEYANADADGKKTLGTQTITITDDKGVSSLTTIDEALKKHENLNNYINSNRNLLNTINKARDAQTALPLSDVAGQTTGESALYSGIPSPAIERQQVKQRERQQIRQQTKADERPDDKSMLETSVYRSGNLQFPKTAEHRQVKPATLGEAATRIDGERKKLEESQSDYQKPLDVEAAQKGKTDTTVSPPQIMPSAAVMPLIPSKTYGYDKTNNVSVKTDSIEIDSGQQVVINAKDITINGQIKNVPNTRSAAPETSWLGGDYPVPVA